MKSFSSKTFQLQSQEDPNAREEREEEKADNKEEHNNKARCDWEFNLRTIISSNSFAAASSAPDALGVTEFDPSGSVLATGGIARKIRFYTAKALLPHHDDDEEHVISLVEHGNACEYYICTPAKLSSLRWRPFSGGGVLGSCDYDGVVMEYDLERRVPIFERDEHGGRRVWSIDYSHFSPVVGASGADDGTMQVWDTRCHDEGVSLATVQPSTTQSSVCCVEFNPFGRTIIAAGCADRRVYLYDTRKMVDAVMVFDGHLKPVTYVRFLDHDKIITSAVDGCLRMWKIEEQRLVRTYHGHVNARRFVGLSVWRGGGLMSCGSENNQVFVYDKRWGEPIWVHRFEPTAIRATGCDFVSSVCWQQLGVDRCTLVAGGSNGVLQVYSGKRKGMIKISGQDSGVSLDAYHAYCE